MMLSARRTHVVRASSASTYEADAVIAMLLTWCKLLNKLVSYIIFLSVFRSILHETLLYECLNNYKCMKKILELCLWTGK